MPDKQPDRPKLDVSIREATNGFIITKRKRPTPPSYGTYMLAPEDEEEIVCGSFSEAVDLLYRMTSRSAATDQIEVRLASNQPSV